MRSKLLMLVLALFVCGSVFAAEGMDEQDKFTLAEKVELAKSISDSVVQVRYYLKTDKGEQPEGASVQRYCPNCGSYHSYSTGSELIKEERPFEAAGYAIGDNKFVAQELTIHPRFVEDVKIAFNGKEVDAEVSAYAKDCGVMMLEAEEELAGVKPLEFNPDAEGDLVAVEYDKANAQWGMTVKGFSISASVKEDGLTCGVGSASGVIMNRQGDAVGICLSMEMPLDDGWKGSPADWELVPAGEMDAMEDKIEQIADGGLLRVKLNLRSPRKNQSSMGYYSSNDDEEKTEIDTCGVLVNAKKLLVLKKLKPKVTARLEKITVYPADGEPVTAEFSGTLKDYGAFVAELSEELEGEVELSQASVFDYRNKPLIYALVRVQGDSKVSYYGHKRIAQFQEGWKSQIYPQVSSGSYDEEGKMFLFDSAGRLVSMPIARREKVESDRGYFYDDDTLMTYSGYLNPVLADLASNVDHSNVPLTEEEENRLAWIGVELQPLNQELARVNNVSDMTKDGENGALVSYVYPNSPAAKKGIELGDVLIRLHIEGVPQPMEVDLSSGYFMESFPWDQYDMIPGEYFDRIPTPWPNAENTFTRALTNVGFGKEYTAEFARDGETFTKEFEVTQSPAHYGSAKKFKSEDLGMTVRNLTYEVQRYFQRTDDDPGVIVSKIEPGEKAAVAGIRPYEIITHVNDKPVSDVEAFENLVKNGEEMRFAVKRMTKGRVVKIKTDAGGDETAEAENEESDETVTAG
ncbi:serine endoprotease [Anaerohalosphaera lusitana]|uniref:Serine endoprotease n=1 Tax=Anaerohalosphaera lusitana TaxID=1936003 RepID=A0A1U9NIR5_9BACT|nr:PDZ domain-containing protein [Anaerohalosphaera lusitana]AQT67715.1 serine endoprotease [Anaerohalosphaera lusitana]